MQAGQWLFYEKTRDSNGFCSTHQVLFHYCERIVSWIIKHEICPLICKMQNRGHIYSGVNSVP